MGVIKLEYTALYRKFRPKTFAEMVGQEHITSTLKNQIISGRVGHAYLFNGGRGTGKTSSAKIFARAINCLNSTNGEPCNECEICRAMLDGSLTDVVEMDAASNNSVEDIRGIREEVNFLPTLAKYRIYIIDEVHMLSTGAFNALLKTLEEPPEHVKFILATTEPQKLPATILSRCQRFDFKKIRVEDIIKRLKVICEESKIKTTDEALKLIAILSEGAMRDSISILERCMQEGKEQITEEQIKELVGIPKLEYISKLVESIAKYQVDEAINTMQDVINDGKDLNNFLWEIIKYVKDVLIYKVNGKLDIYNEIEIEQIANIANKFDKERLLKRIYLLSNLENDMKWSSQKTILFQTGIIRACIETDNTIEERLSRLEQKVKNGVVQAENKKMEAKPKVEKKEKKPDNIAMEKSTNSKSGSNVNYWPKIIDKLKTSGKMMIYTNLLNTKAKETDDSTIEIEFENGLTAFGKTVLAKPENQEVITNLIIQETGKQMKIIYIDKKQKNFNKSNMNGLNNLGIPINIIKEESEWEKEEDFQVEWEDLEALI